jgi:hypothetical protein
MNAQSVVQLLILLDQVSAQVITMLQTIKGFSPEDEDILQDLLKQHRSKNDALYASVMASLAARAEKG